MGYEWERYNPEYPYPVNRSYTTLSNSPVPFNTVGDHAESSIYQAPSGAWVFDAGTIWWGYGLNMAGIVDPRIQQTTANVLNRFVTSYEHPATASSANSAIVSIAVAEPGIPGIAAGLTSLIFKATPSATAAPAPPALTANPSRPP